MLIEQLFAWKARVRVHGWVGGWVGGLVGGWVGGGLGWIWAGLHVFEQPGGDLHRQAIEGRVVHILIPVIALLRTHA